MGGLALENGFTAVGLDHTITVKIATTAVSHEASRRHARRDRQRRVERLDRRPCAGDVPAAAQYRRAEIMGGRRCREPRGVARAARAERRDGLSVGADREDVGFLRRALQRQAIQVPAAVRELRHRERALQDRLPDRVSWSERRRSRDQSASAREGPPERHRARRSALPQLLDGHPRQDRPAAQLRRSRPLHAVHDRGRHDLSET